MASPLAISPTEEGDIRANNAVWATARNATTGTLDKVTTENQRVFSLKSGNYYIQRGFMAFALTSIPASATITAVSLRLLEGSGTGIDTYIDLGTQSDTLVADDYNNVTDTSYATYTGIGSPQLENLTFNAAGIAKVQELIGSTLKLCLRDEFDHTNSAVIGNENENALWKNITYATENQRPLLTVTYTLPSSGFFALL